MKIGDRVRIKKEHEAYFGKYAGTEATVVTYNSESYCQITTFDGKTYMSPPAYLEVISETPPPIPESHKEICDHKNKYWNVVSITMKFWVCPDCGKEIK